MRPGRIAVLLLVFFSLASGAGAVVVIPREIRVGVAVAPNFKTIHNWKGEFERRLAYASKIFGTEFKLKFKPAVYWDWNPRDPEGDMDSLMEELKSRFPLEETDIVIGLTRLEEIPSAEQMRDLHVLGRARPFSGYLVMRYPFNRLYTIQEETVMVHELAHLFGAVHAGKDTIMSPVVDRQIPTRFDPQNRAIIMLTREMDFKKGTAVLDSRMMQTLLGSYMELINARQSYDFYYMLGVFYLNLGKDFEALKAWKAARDLDHKNPQIHFDIGTLYYKAGRYDEAIRELGQAVAGMVYPSQKPNKALALRMLGAAYFQKGNYNAAQNVWTRALASDPGNTEILADLGTLKINSGQASQAVDDFLHVLRKDPDNIKALSYLGLAYYQTGRMVQALEYLKKAEVLMNRRDVAGGMAPVQKAEIHKNLGQVYLKMNNPGEAVSQFEEACRSTATPDCHKILGEVYFQLGKWDQAVGELSAVLRVRKQDSDLYGMLGVALAQKRDFQRALSVFNEGLQHVKDRKTKAVFHKNIGYIFINAKSWNSAEKEFRASIRDDWKGVESHFGLALACLHQNNINDAKSSLRTVLQLNPSHKEAREILGRLD